MELPKKRLTGSRKRRLLLKSLNNIEVTKELEKGTSGMNSSLLGGRGNFFGFLGFHEGDQPVQIIREYFRRSYQDKEYQGKIKESQRHLFPVGF